MAQRNAEKKYWKCAVFRRILCYVSLMCASHGETTKSHEAYTPYTPLSVLKPVDQGIWIADGPEIPFEFARMKIPFPTRMTVVRLPSGDVWVHSPTEPEESLLDSVRAIGRVRFLVAPNTLHYWWIPAWKTRFPDAEVFAAPDLDRRAKRPLAIDHTLEDVPPSAWTSSIDQALVRGDVMTEVVFFHRPSRTLILTDLIENFEPQRVRYWFHRLMLRVAGAADPDGKAPIDMQLSFWLRRKAVRAAVQRMMAWNPEKIILAHGRWYDRDGSNELRRAFRWVL